MTITYKPSYPSADPTRPMSGFWYANNSNPMGRNRKGVFELQTMDEHAERALAIWLKTSDDVAGEYFQLPIADLLEMLTGMGVIPDPEVEAKVARLTNILVEVEANGGLLEDAARRLITTGQIVLPEDDA